jgi:putative membrane protein
VCARPSRRARRGAGRGTVTTDGSWRRLHPLSPVVRAGRATIAIAVLLVPSVLGGGNPAREYPQLAVVAVLAAVGFVSWYVTRWRIDGDDLQIETGVLRRRSLRFPLAQVQAVDIVRPGLARLFRVAELRLRLGGASGDHARLAYLNEREVEPLRARLLALAQGAEPTEAPAAAEREEVLAVVPTPRLVASVLLSDVGFVSELVLLGLVLGAIFAPSAARGIASGGAADVLAVGALAWRRFNQEYRFRLAEADDGLRLHSGLVALNTETIRPGRVQAVRMVEPFLWRRLGWCRLEVDIAGRQRRDGEGQTTRGQLHALLPVGSRRLALELVERLVPAAPRPTFRPPRRALLKSPLAFRFLAWGRSEQAVVSQSGRIRRVTVWVPLEKVQSLRRVEGPLQRRLRLASISIDAAGRGRHAVLRDRRRSEADVALADLVRLARSARAG